MAQIQRKQRFEDTLELLDEAGNVCVTLPVSLNLEDATTKDTTSTDVVGYTAQEPTQLNYDLSSDSLYGGNYAGIIGETVSMPLYNKNMDFVVVGVYKYQASIYTMNSSSSAYIPLKAAQSITHYDRYTSFSVVSQVGVDSDELAVSIKDYLNGFYRNSNRLEVETYNMASMISG